MKTYLLFIILFLNDSILHHNKLVLLNKLHVNPQNEQEQYYQNLIKRSHEQTLYDMHSKYSHRYVLKTVNS